MLKRIRNFTIEEMKDYKAKVRYVIIGVITQFLDLSTYAILVNLGMNYVLADLINSPLPLLFNYFGHKYFTFSQKKWSNKEVRLYVYNLIFNYFYSTAVLIFFISILGAEEVVGKIAQIVAIPIINFLVLKRIVFVKEEE